MGILAVLESLLGRPAELSEYAPKVEAEIEALTARVEALEGGQAEASSEVPTQAADGIAPAAPTAS